MVAPRLIYARDEVCEPQSFVTTFGSDYEDNREQDILGNLKVEPMRIR